MPTRDLHHLALRKPPPLDEEWLSHEESAGLREPKPVLKTEERQPLYATQCRALNASMMEPGAPYQDLASGVGLTRMSVKNETDGYDIPLLKYELEESTAEEEKEQVVVVYYHGGGLRVGEADSEELSIRRLVKHASSTFATSSSSSRIRRRAITVYSPSYRLMPQIKALTILSDALSTFRHVAALHPEQNLVVVGSSSGGELAALVSQEQDFAERLRGLMLRCPVTSDAWSGPDYIPTALREMHTSADEAFATTLLGPFRRNPTRDGLKRTPLEMDVKKLAARKLPRTWVQVCTNDVLYSDGVCYAQLLLDAGVDVELDVIEGWPHTFWLKAPQLERALGAEEEMMKALSWVLEK